MPLFLARTGDKRIRKGILDSAFFRGKADFPHMNDVFLLRPFSNFVIKLAESRRDYGSAVEKTESRKTLDHKGKRDYFGGGADQDRNGDLLNAIQRLFQIGLSIPAWIPRGKNNFKSSVSVAQAEKTEKLIT